MIKSCMVPGCEKLRYESPKGKKYSHCSLHKSRKSRLGKFELDPKPASKSPKEYWKKHKEKMDLIKKGNYFLIYCASCSESMVSKISVSQWTEAPLCDFCKVAQTLIKCLTSE